MDINSVDSSYLDDSGSSYQASDSQATDTSSDEDTVVAEDVERESSVGLDCLSEFGD